MESRDEFRDPTGARASGDVGRTQERMREEVRGFGHKARATSERLAGRARDEASRLVEERKGKAAHGLESLSGALRDGAGRLRQEENAFGMGGYAESAAEAVERLARYLRDSEPERFVHDAEEFARRRPEVFVGGMFVAGLLVARFLRSSGQRSYRAGNGPSGERAGWGPDTSYQPESGSYAGSPGMGVSGQPSSGRPHDPATGTGRTGRVDIAPDDESGLGV